MLETKAIGIDLSKSVIHVHAADGRGRQSWRKKLEPSEFSQVLLQLPEKSLVYMEACSSAYYWSRKVESLGHRARQISPQHVKPFVKSQKNDYNDAEATLEAGSRPSMLFVPTKTVGQQELQALHSVRTRRFAERTALINQLRAILSEHGVSIARSPRALKHYLSKNFPADKELSISIRETVLELAEELTEIEQRIKVSEARIIERAKASPVVKRLMTIPGIGFLTATALAVVSGDPSQFKNGRQFAAWLGLVPRQVSTGGKTILRGISKRGDVYVRCLLVHGSRSIVRHALKKDDPHSLWIRKLHAAKGTNITAVAVANKNARIAWKLLTSNKEYDPALSHGASEVQRTS